MRLAIALLVLGVLATGTARHIPHFASDRELWGAAVKVTPSLPRPLLNLGTVYRKQGYTNEAVALLMRAADVADRSTRAQEIRGGVRAQLLFLSAFGDDVCSRPDVQPYCF